MESWIGIRALISSGKVPEMHVGFLPFTCYRELRKKMNFVILFQCFGDFHTAKYVEHCIGKYIKGSCIQESLRQTQVFGVNVDVNIHSKATLF